MVFTPPVADLTSETHPEKAGCRCSEAFIRAVQTPRWGHGGLSFLMENIMAVVQYVRQLGKTKETKGDTSGTVQTQPAL